MNERLLVYGVPNLRVVDTSIFSMVPRGNIQSTIYAVAERVADIIKEDRLARKMRKVELLRRQKWHVADLCLFLEPCSYRDD